MLVYQFFILLTPFLKHKVPPKSVRPAHNEMLSHHTNIQLRAISLESWRELKDGGDLYHMMILDASYTFPAEQS